MKIGLSLSFCICDLLDEKIACDQVAFIVTGTKAPTRQAWDRVVDQYCQTYWSSDPVRARRLANRLYEQGKILQPRVWGCECPNIAEGHWARIEK